ncbi:carbohydrate ABC transporter permease [Bifidobacterium longum]|uniref:carbohydrate ABC transporter permease n=1 Tax=Bifidobacterium longum TaxID=216816 RepID=UPI000AACC9BB|nr:sugar ABC transporter permease [Bifidobacterium longum]UNU71944.1 sugar ABC transporter permease [Bifidobacterium longum]
MSNAAAAAGKRVRARKHSGASQNSWQSKLRPYLFIAPLVILSGVFIYYCIGFTVATSFTDWDGIFSEMDFIGLKNYTKLLAPGSVFWTALMNNIIFMVVTVVIQAGLGLLLAVILKERLRGSSFFKAIFFMPIAMAPVIIAASSASSWIRTSVPSTRPCASCTWTSWPKAGLAIRTSPSTRSVPSTSLNGWASR